MAIAAAAAVAAQQQSQQHSDVEIDPRELETFAERFKQRRIKLGVTQADVGQQLSKLKLPGVGSLSQSRSYKVLLLLFFFDGLIFNKVPKRYLIWPIIDFTMV